MESLASAYRDKRTSVKEELLAEPYYFEFYQAVKLIEMFYLSERIDNDISKGILEEAGRKDFTKKYFEQENYRLFGGPVVFRSNIESAFPASDLELVKAPRAEGDPYEMFVNFMGMAGLSGPLPAFYSQVISDNEKENPNNTLFRDFLDLFNNHLVYLMYKVRRKSRIGFDLRNPADIPVSKYLFSLIGMGSDGLRNKLSIKDYELLYYTGLLANHNRSISGVEFILSDYLGVKVSCQPLQGSWQPISDFHISLLGTGGQNQILGDSVVLGRAAWDQSAQFNICIGPVTENQYINFLPLKNSISFRPLYELTRQYVGTETVFEAVLIVESSKLKGIKLNDPVYSRLGWTSWLPLREKSFYDYENLFLIRSRTEIKLELEHGKKLRLGWTVWIPDEKGHIKYVEIRINSNSMEQYI